MSNEEKQRIELVSLEQIVPLPGNVTVIGREEDMMLRTDMTRLESRGLYKIDPILLRRLTPEEIQQIKTKQPWSQAQYQIIDGHSRWRAARELGWTRIRAIIIDASLEEAYAINYMKNKARGTIDPMREAAYFRYLREVKGFTVDKIAEKFGMSHKEVDRILSRLKIIPEAQEVLSIAKNEGSALTPIHYEIIGSTEPNKQKTLAEIIVKEELTTRQAEIAKEAIQKELPPEKAVEVVKVVKREKLAPKEAKKVVQAIAIKPEIAEKIAELPKEKLVEEAEKILKPPAPSKPEPEEILRELSEYYPPLIIDYAYSRSKNLPIKEVIKAAIFYAWWEKLAEQDREEVTAKAIKEVKAKGKFEQPVIG